MANYKLTLTGQQVQQYLLNGNTAYTRTTTLNQQMAITSETARTALSTARNSLQKSEDNQNAIEDLARRVTTNEANIGLLETELSKATDTVGTLPIIDISIRTTATVQQSSIDNYDTIAYVESYKTFVAIKDGTAYANFPGLGGAKNILTDNGWTFRDNIIVRYSNQLYLVVQNTLCRFAIVENLPPEINFDEVPSIG